jgi:ABC-type transporter Mla subunit MlaD
LARGLSTSTPTWVTSISVYRHDLAIVGFSIQQGRQLPASVTATIKYLNLVGQRYIELGQGTGPVDAALPPGGTIPLSRTTPALNLTDLFNGFQPLSPGDVNKLTSEIIATFQGESPDTTALVATVGSLTTSLATKDLVALHRLTGVAVATINASQANFVADLNELAPTLRELADAGQNLPNALQVLLTYPFTNQVRSDVKGDYLNVFLSLRATKGTTIIPTIIPPRHKHRASNHRGRH